MNIGLIDVDGHNFPNFALMRTSAYHKDRGDQVEWASPFSKYDKVIASKIFTFTPDFNYLTLEAGIIEKGGLTMGFTTPCFIRKNTPELREKLKRIGVRPFLLNEELNSWGDNIKVFGWEMVAFSCSDSLNDCKDYIDCGTNEELFLAIAALRDDSNYMQWFITDSPLSVSHDDSIGNDHYFTEPKGSMFFWDENWNHATIISGSYHKATVEELINHFK